MSPLAPPYLTSFLVSFRYYAEEISLPTHTGTHIDAPTHFAASKWTLSEIPDENLVDVPGVTIDVSKKCIGNPLYEVTVQDLEVVAFPHLVKFSRFYWCRDFFRHLSLEDG